MLYLVLSTPGLRQFLLGRQSSSLGALDQIGDGEARGFADVSLSDEFEEHREYVTRRFFTEICHRVKVTHSDVEVLTKLQDKF